MRLARTVLAMAVALLIAVPVLAQEKPKKGGGGRPGMRPFAYQLRMLEGLNLSSEQKSKVDALVKELSPKMQEATKARQGILSEEQNKAFFAAMRSAREAGKQGKEMMDAAMAEAKVTDEQKAKFAEVEKKTMEVQKEFTDQVRELLTPEQRDELKKKMEEFRGKAKGKGKDK